MSEIIKIHEGQDLYKQKDVIKMYGISHTRLADLEKSGLPRYQLDTRTVFYSLKEVEKALKEASIVWKRKRAIYLNSRLALKAQRLFALSITRKDEKWKNLW